MTRVSPISQIPAHPMRLKRALLSEKLCFIDVDPDPDSHINPSNVGKQNTKKHPRPFLSLPASRLFIASYTKLV